MLRVDPDRALCLRMKFIRELLSEFGAKLSGYDPGVTAYLDGKCRGDGYFGEHLSFDSKEWAWLEPLLVELRERRKACAAPAPGTREKRAVPTGDGARGRRRRR